MVATSEKTAPEQAAAAICQIESLSCLIRPRKSVTLLTNAEGWAFEYQSVRRLVEHYRLIGQPCPAETVEREKKALASLLLAYRELVAYIHSHQRFDRTGRLLKKTE